MRETNMWTMAELTWMIAEEEASEGKVLEEVDESNAHMSTLDSLEVDAESDGAPNMWFIFHNICFWKPTFSCALRISTEEKTMHKPTLWFKEGKRRLNVYFPFLLTLSTLNKNSQ